MREGGARQVQPIDQRFQNLAGIGAVQGDGGPLFRRRGQPDIQIGPFGLKIILHHVQNPRGAPGGGGDVEQIG